METAKEIGIRIKNSRLNVGITQAELARRLGVTPQTISQYERGVKKPKIETIERIADALGISWLQLAHLENSIAASEERGLGEIKENIEGLVGGEQKECDFIPDIEEVSKSATYTTAELFIMAAELASSRVAFFNYVTMTIPDDATGCVYLGTEKERLSTIWELARLSMRELVDRTGLSQTAFAKGAGIPLRTVQDWCGEKRACPAYVRFLLAEHYGLLKTKSKKK